MIGFYVNMYRVKLMKNDLYVVTLTEEWDE